MRAKNGCFEIAVSIADTRKVIVERKEPLLDTIDLGNPLISPFTDNIAQNAGENGVSTVGMRAARSTCWVSW